MQPTLAFPVRRHKRLWRAFRDEFAREGVRYVPGLGSLEETYGAFLRRVRRSATGQGIPKEHVPSTKYFLMDEGGHKIYGAIDIRHRLNDALLHRGGHIGYSVAPGERRRGYGTQMLRLALVVCRNMGMERVLVTCDKANVASARVVQHCGGVLEDERTDAEGVVFQRYWIALGQR